MGVRAIDAPRVLVTGGCGFIGSNFIRNLLIGEPDAEVTNLDLLTYAGNPNNLGIWDRSKRYHFIQGDVCRPEVIEPLVARSDWIVNFAAETHVDRSIHNAADFVQTNIAGTFVILDALRKHPRARLLQVSTDEVYGSVEGFPDESAPLNPTSPYAAAKAAADLLALSFHRTYGTDVVISRSTNNYGPCQHPEKFIPLFITRSLEDRQLPLYDGGVQIRDWLWVGDHCEALLLLLKEGRSGWVYNVGANQSPEVNNISVARMILERLDRPLSLIEPAYGARPGHDFRYAVNTGRIRALGWEPTVSLHDGIKLTVDWYVQQRRESVHGAPAGAS